MKLENDFEVPVGVDQAWAALNDPERVAPCFPGATLESVDGDSFTGSVKLKLGPISMVYKGTGTFVERDAAAHRVVIDTTGRDSRGGGQAKAMVTGTLVAHGPDSTAVRLVTDLTITGKPAQLGRGMIADVSNRIVGQFAACLAQTLAETPAAPTASVTPEPTPAQAVAEPTPAAPEPARATSATVVDDLDDLDPGDTAGTSDAGVATAAAAVPEPTPAPAPTPTPVQPRRSAESIDLLATAGAPVAKRLIPAIIVVGLIVTLAIWLATR